MTLGVAVSLIARCAVARYSLEGGGLVGEIGSGSGGYCVLWSVTSVNVHSLPASISVACARDDYVIAWRCRSAADDSRRDRCGRIMVPSVCREYLLAMGPYRLLIVRVIFTLCDSSFA